MAGVWRLRGILGTLFTGILLVLPSAILTNLTAFPDIFLWIGVAVTAAIFLVFVAILPHIWWTHFKYAITDDEIIIKRGIFIVEHTVVPMIKIQYTDTSYGPILRLFKLASVKVMTAGGTEEIPGQLLAEATEMRDRITDLVKLVKENV